MTVMHRHHQMLGTFPGNALPRPVLQPSLVPACFWHFLLSVSSSACKTHVELDSDLVIDMDSQEISTFSCLKTPLLL